MSLAATATSVMNQMTGACTGVVNRLKLAAEDVMESRPVDNALNAVAGLLGQRQDVDEMLARIDTLEQEIELMRQRDVLLSRHMTKIDEEHRLAARIQQDFLPKQLPAVGAIRFEAIFRPAHYVSGDLYDIKRLDETNVGVYIADAVGHGMPAALLTMFMKNALLTKRIHENGYSLVDPSETLARLNHSLRAQDLNHASFATAIYARIDCRAGRVCFARGGHPNPLILRADGTLDEATADGALLGVFDDNEWDQACIQLNPGDRLFLYTDGVEAAFNDGEKPDADQWRRELFDRRDRPSAEILGDFARAMEERSGAIPKDDLTIVVAEMK
jgi:phosphoserine phosphatase RsbU/P